MNNIMNIINNIVARLNPVPGSLGVEISNNSIKMALVRKDAKGSASLMFYDIAPHDGGQNQELLTAFEKALKDLNLNPSTHINFVVSGEHTDSKRISLPSMPNEEIAHALRWQAKDHFLFNLDESMLDFEILDRDGDKTESSGIEVLSSIAKNIAIDSRISLLKNTQFVPYAVLPVSYALVQVYSLLSPAEMGSPVALIDIGCQTTTIVIIKNKAIRFIRQLGRAGNDFTKAMTGVFVSDAGRLDISPEKAEEMKREFGFPDESLKELKPGITVSQIISMISPVMESLSNEIRRSFEYYASQFREGDISRIYISGGTSKMKNIESQLSRILAMQVERLDMPDGIKIKLAKNSQDNIKEDFAFMAPAIGAALYNQAGANLIPVSYKARKAEKLKLLSARIVFIAVASVLSVFYLFNITQENALHKVLNAKQPQWQKLQEVQALHSRITQKNIIISYALSRQVPLYYAFKSLSNIIPKQAYLIKLSIDDYATTMQIEGVVFKAGELPEITLSRFIKSLEDSPFFNNVSLNSTQDADISNKEAVEFRISCNLVKK